MQKLRPGFTLVELLISIGIIGVLMAILLPIVGSLRASARAIQCASNLRQISVACASYMSFAAGRIPNNSYTVGDDPTALNPQPPFGTLGASYAQQRGYQSTSNLEWFDIVAEVNGWNGKRTVAARYGAGEQDLFRRQTQYLWCPGIEQSAQDPGIRATSYGICRIASQCYNCQGSPATPGKGPLDFLNYKGVKRVADVVFLTEGRYWHAHADAYDLTNASLANVSKYYSPMQAKVRHHGVNYLFFDGHVSLMGTPPHSMGGELGSFTTADGDTYTITAATDYAFRSQLSP